MKPTIRGKPLLLVASTSIAYFYYRSHQTLTQNETMIIVKLDENVFIKCHNFLSYGMIPLSSRMTIIRNHNDLILYNPVPISKEEIKNLGQVKYIIVGNQRHIKFFTDVLHECSSNGKYPTVLCATGVKSILEEILKNDQAFKSEEIEIKELFQSYPNLLPTEWQNIIEWKQFCGMNFLKEIVLYHKPSKLFIVTDTAVNFSTKEYHGVQYFPIMTLAVLNDVYNKLSVPRYYTLLADKAETTKTLEDLYNKDVRGIIVAHGPPVISDCVKEQWYSEWKKRL
jgi:hypothetical protein